ncbi:MAG: hypothetical protein AB8F34_05625 [Akkermansiaceae bacterium]
MRPRFDTAQHFRYRHSAHFGSPSSPPRDSVRFDRPASPPQQTPEEKAITTAELNGFALGCIEKLAFPSQADDDSTQSVEDTIAQVIIEKLPSYTALKATLAASTTAHAENHAWSSPLQINIEQLQIQVGQMQETIANHLIQTGQEIGLPTPLLHKLADLTKTILERYAT